MGEVKIVLRVDDQTGNVIDGTAGKLEGLGSSGRSAAAGLDSLNRAAGGLTSTASRGLNILTRLDITQLTLTASAERVAHAQAQYNQALSEHGANSEQARGAARQLEAAQTANEKAALRAKLQVGLLGLEVAAFTATTIPRAIAGLVAMRAAAIGAAGGMTAFNVTATLGVAAASIAAGLIVATVALNKFGAATREGEASLEGFGDDGSAALAKTKGEVDKLQSSFSKAHVDLSRFTSEGRARLLELAGASQAVSATILEAGAAEEVFEASMLRGSEALRNQTTVTRKKDETMQEFVNRLLLLGFTEAEIRARVNETGTALLGQEAATRQATGAMREFQAVQGGGTAGQFGSSRATRSVGVFDAYPGLGERIAMGQVGEGELSRLSDEHLAQLGITRAQAGSYGRGSQFNFAGITFKPPTPPPPASFTPFRPPLKHTGEFVLEGSALELAQAFADAKVTQFDQPLPRPQTGPEPRRAAHGFEGMIGRPTLFLAGEAGPEHVRVTPAGRGQPGVTNATVNVYLAPGEGTEEGVERGALRAIRSLSGRRLAARRSY